MKNFLLFRRMLTPLLVQILFWLGLVFAILVGIFNLLHRDFWVAFQLIFIAPLLLRIIAEFFLVIFRIEKKLR